MNRNYFAAVALLPGVQFSPSNQMGNDTIVANGQTAQNNERVGGRRLQHGRCARHEHLARKCGRRLKPFRNSR